MVLCRLLQNCLAEQAGTEGFACTYRLESLAEGLVPVATNSKHTVFLAVCEAVPAFDTA